MATVPLSGTNVRFLSNIPFNNDYKNTRWFTSKGSQTTYFQSKPVVHAESEMNFQRIEGKHFVAINKSIDELWGANYIMFQNAHYNNKWFYAFITNLEYKQRNNTHVHFEIDVLQTWKFDMNFKPSYVVREHRALWNNDGTPVINTIDEGLNYGTDYDVVSTVPFTPHGNYKWLVVVSKTKFTDNEITSTVVGTPQPLHYYAVPYRDNNTTPNVFLEKANVGISSLLTPSQILGAVYKNVATVNDIVSVYVTDYIGVEHTYDNAEDTITFPDNRDDVGRVLLAGNPDGSDPLGQILYFEHVEQFKPTYRELYTDKYSGFRSVKESKLLMYPYTTLVLTDFKGNTTEFKLEFINSKKVRVEMKGSLGTSNYTTVSIPEYNRLTGDGQTVKTSMEHALISNNPNDVPILTDMLSAFLQGNKNSLETQKSQIIFNGFMNTIGAGVGAGASATAKIPNPVGVVSSGLGMVQGMGNAIYDLQGIQSKQQDINNIPPQLAKMGSNSSFSYGNGYNGFFLMKKQIKPEYIKILSDFFNMFGYKTNEVKIPNFRTRDHWNYVQTESCVITGNFNNQDLVELKTIFDSGITLWHTDDIGNYNLENGVR